MVKTKYLALAMAAVALCACGDGVLADRGDVVYLTPWEAGGVAPQVVPDTRPEVTDGRADEYVQLMAGVEAQAGRFFGSSQSVEFLGAVEQAYLLTGNYFDLVALLEEQTQAQGPGSMAARSLAWTYLQLGDEPRAAAMIDDLKEAAPDAPQTWVVVGAYHANRVDESVDQARKARDAFAQVLALDPDFDGFMAMEGSALRQQLEALERQVPDTDADDGAVADGTEAAEDESSEQAEDDGSSDDDAGTAVATALAAAVDQGQAVADQAPAIAVEVAEIEADEADEAVSEDAASEEDPASADDGLDDKTRAALYVARGQRAMQSGSDRLEEAQGHFRQALEYDDNSLDAGIGLLRVAARSDAPEEMLAEQVDRLAERQLSARQAYELGLFCLRNLKDDDRATSLLERVEQLDPQLAQRLGVSSLLER